MKKLVVLFFAAAALVSCGKDKKNIDAEKPVNKAMSLEIGGTFVKDDSLAVFYKIDGYYNYDHPVTKVIKGSDLPQKITFDMPAGVAAENFSIVTSTNKDQAFITITEITIKDGDNTIDGKEYKYIPYFLSDNSFTWDEKNSRFTLSHSNKYPPGMVGTEKLETLLIK